MSGSASLSLVERLSRVTWYAYEILLLTSVHHAYGAYIYATPWRLHAIVAAFAAAVLIGASAGVYGGYTGIRRTIAFWILCAVTFGFPIAMIGFFEGGYNHLLKNVLYFGGASRELMQTLFPAPTYELPNSVFFEVSGVAQLIVAILCARHLYQFALERLGQRSRLIRSGIRDRAVGLTGR